MYDIAVTFLDQLSFGDVCFILSQLFIIVGFSFNDILWLRLVTMGAFLLLILAAIFLDNKLMLIFGLFFLVFNMIRLAKILLDRRPITLYGDCHRIYHSFFSVMRPQDFLVFWEMGELIQQEDGFLYTEGDVFQGLYFVSQGEVVIRKEGREIVTLSDGFFIGEMSFLTAESASADVEVLRPVTMCFWSHELLSQLQFSNPDLFMKLHMVIGCDLVTKLRSETHVLKPYFLAD